VDLALLLPLHMGGLHPYEQALVLLLAFGPFVVLAVVIYIARKRDHADAAAEAAASSEPPATPGD
jgi:hypothetical protein